MRVLFVIPPLYVPGQERRPPDLDQAKTLVSQRFGRQYAGTSIGWAGTIREGLELAGRIAIPHITIVPLLSPMQEERLQHLLQNPPDPLVAGAGVFIHPWRSLKFEIADRVMGQMTGLGSPAHLFASQDILDLSEGDLAKQFEETVVTGS